MSDQSWPRPKRPRWRRQDSISVPGKSERRSSTGVRPRSSWSTWCCVKTATETDGLSHTVPSFGCRSPVSSLIRVDWKIRDRETVQKMRMSCLADYMWLCAGSVCADAQTFPHPFGPSMPIRLLISTVTVTFSSSKLPSSPASSLFTPLFVTSYLNDISFTFATSGCRSGAGSGNSKLNTTTFSSSGLGN